MPSPAFDLDRLLMDMALLGWNGRELAKHSGLSPKTVYKFMDGSVQTAKTAKKLASALGYHVRRYIKMPRRMRRVA